MLSFDAPLGVDSMRLAWSAQNTGPENLTIRPVTPLRHLPSSTVITLSGFPVEHTAAPIYCHNLRTTIIMSLDHIILPCPASILDEEVAFLNAALEPLGIKERFRIVPQVVAFGDEADPRFFWVSGLNREQLPVEDKDAPGMHIAFKAKGGLS